jgi:hypothetical protein
MSLFDQALKKYMLNASINPRASVPLFQGLANQGSIAAGFTAGLLSAQADQADYQDKLLAAAMQGQTMQLELQKVNNDTSRTQAQNNLSMAQAGKLGVESQGQQIQNQLLNQYGAAKEVASIRLANANAYQSQAAGANALANANGQAITNKLLATFGPSKEAAAIAFTKAQTANTLTDAQVAVLNAGTNQFNALTARINAGTGQYNAETTRFSENNKTIVDAGQLAVQQYGAVTGRINAGNSTIQAQTEQQRLQVAREEAANNDNYRTLVLQDNAAKAKVEAELEAKKQQTYDSLNKLRLAQLNSTEQRQSQLHEATMAKINGGGKLNDLQKLQAAQLLQKQKAATEQGSLITEQGIINQFKKAYDKTGAGIFNSYDANKAISKLSPESVDYLKSLLGDDLSALSYEDITNILSARSGDIRSRLEALSTINGN